MATKVASITGQTHYFWPMAREYGPFRERFEEYILERTANHPSVVPNDYAWSG